MNEKIILYTTLGCPKCAILEKKLTDKNIPFKVCQDVNIMMNLGIKACPVMALDGNLMDYASSVKWVNGR